MASVTFEHLTKTYPNGFVSVNDVNLFIEDGEFVVFHGPSGCGKSTILRMIGGLEDITSGKIYLGEELLNDILPRDRRLAMAFQNYTLYRHFPWYRYGTGQQTEVTDRHAAPACCPGTCYRMSPKSSSCR